MTTVRYQLARSTAIYAIDSQHRVVSVSETGTISPLSVGIPVATEVRPDHQGNIVVAGGNKIVERDTSRHRQSGAAGTFTSVTIAGSVVDDRGVRPARWQLDVARHPESSHHFLTLRVP